MSGTSSKYSRYSGFSGSVAYSIKNQNRFTAAGLIDPAMINSSSSI